MKMNNQADANKVINRYRNQVSEMSHELMLMGVLREQDTEEIERLTEEGKTLRLDLEIAERKLKAFEETEENSPEVIEG